MLAFLAVHFLTNERKKEKGFKKRGEKEGKRQMARDKSGGGVSGEAKENGKSRVVGVN